MGLGLGGRRQDVMVEKEGGGAVGFGGFGEGRRRVEAEMQTGSERGRWERPH